MAKKVFTDQSLETFISEIKSYTDNQIAAIPSVDSYTKSEMDAALAQKAESGHSHNDVYYTESEIDTKLASKADSGHSHSNYVPTSRTVNGKTLSENVTLSASDVGADASGTAASAVSSHNISGTAHSDIRDLISDHTGDATIHVTSTNKSNWNAAYNHSTVAHAPSNAEKNQNAFSKIVANGTTVAADSTEDTLTIAAGTGITVAGDATNDKVTITNAGVRSIATGTANGTINVNTNGTTANVAVKGLGSAAYTASTAYAPAEHGHDVSDISGVTSTADELNILDGATITTTELNYLGGVTSSIQSQIDSKADDNHNHDDRYYTETEVNDKLAGKADKSHGNHVPATQTASNKVFLRNDNTWATVTPANIGAAAASHDHNDIYYTETEINSLLAGKAASTHSHAIADVTNLQSSLDAINDELDGSIKSLSVSGKTITYTMNNGTTGSITTQDTNTKVTNTLATTTKAYVTGTTSNTTNTGTQVFDTGVYLDTTAGQLVATTFKGALDGNAKTATSATSAGSATKATQDASGNIITATYETKNDAAEKLADAKGYTDTAISNLINSAPTTLDTLGEIATAMEANADIVAALEESIGSKAASTHTHSNYASTITTTGSGNAITAISQSGNTITATKGATFLTAHPTITMQTASTSAASPAHGKTFTAIDNITKDGNGHVTQINTKTITLPGETNLSTATATTAASTLSHSGTFKAITGLNVSGHKITPVTTTFTLPADKDTTYDIASSTTAGLVKVGYTASGKNYPVQLSDGKMYVNVPWTDNNTTYSAAGSSLGLVKTGGDVTISNGEITVNDDSHNHIVSNVDGLSDTLTSLQDQIDDKAKVSHTHTVTHTPAGTVNSKSITPAGTIKNTFTGTASTHNHTFTGTAAAHGHTFNGTASTIKSGYTPAGSVSSTFSGTAKNSTTASGTTTVYSITGVGSTPSLTASVANKCLTLSFSAGSTPTRSSVTVPTSGHTHSVTAAGTISNKFTGTAATISASYTPAGTIAETSITPSGSIGSASITPAGSVASTFSGTAASHDHGFTGTASTLTTSAEQ